MNIIVAWQVSTASFFAVKVCLICTLYSQPKHHKTPLNFTVSAVHLTSLSMDGGLFEETLRDCHLENFPVLAIYVEVLEKNTFISSLSTLCGLMLGFK